jgi:hypothetical protein
MAQQPTGHDILSLISITHQHPSAKKLCRWVNDNINSTPIPNIKVTGRTKQRNHPLSARVQRLDRPLATMMDNMFLLVFISFKY